MEQEDTERNKIYANEIKMSGLPFMLQGWNSKFKKTGKDSEDCPIYHLEAYTLYFFIPILGVEIKRVNGIWILQRECDPFGFYCAIHERDNELYRGDVPYGTWRLRGSSRGDDITVVPVW